MAKRPQWHMKLKMIDFLDVKEPRFLVNCGVHGAWTVETSSWPLANSNRDKNDLIMWLFWTFHQTKWIKWNESFGMGGHNVKLASVSSNCPGWLCWGVAEGNDYIVLTPEPHWCLSSFEGTVSEYELCYLTLLDPWIEVFDSFTIYIQHLALLCYRNK